MNRTSPSSRLVSSAARSPDLAITGPGGGAEADAQLARDDLRQRGLAEPRRAEEQHMVERLAAALRGLDEHAQILARRLLPDELVERLGPQRGVDILGPAIGGGDAVGVGHRSSSRMRSPVENAHDQHSLGVDGDSKSDATCRENRACPRLDRPLQPRLRPLAKQRKNGAEPFEIVTRDNGPKADLLYVLIARQVFARRLRDPQLSHADRDLRR